MFDLIYYPIAANTVQITVSVQIYSDIVQLFAQWKTCLPYRSARARKTVTLPLFIDKFIAYSSLLLDVLVFSYRLIVLLVV